MSAEIRPHSPRASAFGARVLDALASVWPSPVARRMERFGAQPGTPEYHRAYARWQFDLRVSGGLTPKLDAISVLGADVLEIGCGHGGVSCYVASVGAKSVLGIDLNEINLAYARELAGEISAATGRPLPVRFEVMNALSMALPDASIDIVLADNLFEHVDPAEALMREIHRVLRPGGRLLVPTFSAIRSKYGLHLKHGLRLPWANLIFSDKTIIEAVRRQAEKHPELYDVYPGLKGDPERVRDLRRHKDLNDITHAEFLDTARKVGFDVKVFRVHPTGVGKALLRVAPRLETSALGEVLSTGAGAILVKPGA